MERALLIFSEKGVVDMTQKYKNVGKCAKVF
jgi:hypothetical protein